MQKPHCVGTSAKNAKPLRTNTKRLTVNENDVETIVADLLDAKLQRLTDGLESMVTVQQQQTLVQNRHTKILHQLDVSIRGNGKPGLKQDVALIQEKIQNLESDSAKVKDVVVIEEKVQNLESISEKTQGRIKGIHVAGMSAVAAVGGFILTALANAIPYILEMF